MLKASDLSDLKKAVRDSRGRGTYGAKVVPDDVFSKSGEIVDIATRAVENGTVVTIAQKHTWSIVEPDAPLPTRVTNMAHYRFDETSGTEAADATANDNDLTVSGATWAAGKFGNCLSFDGSNDSASATLTSTEPLRNYLYVSAWVNPTSVSGTRPICKLSDRFVLYLDAGELKAQFIDGVTTYTVSSGLIVVNGSWQFLTVQLIGGQVLIGLDDLVYRGSIAMTSYAEEFPAVGKALTVGSDGTNYFAGKIDELMLDANVRVMDDWPVVSQIGGFHDVILWPFYENTGTLVHSTKLLGPVLTLTGATWTTGRTRYGVAFDGVNDFGECTPTAETFTGVTVSVEVGVKFSVDEETPIITQAGGINLTYDGAGGIVAALGGVSNPTSVVGSFTPTVDTWYNIVIQYDGTTKSCWINGQKVGEIVCTGTATMPAVPMYVARDGSTYSQITVDRVRVYRASLRPYYRVLPLFQPNIHGFSAVADWITA